jgi:hypothetical protein
LELKTLIEIWQEKRERGLLNKSILVQNNKFAQTLRAKNAKKLDLKANTIHDEVFLAIDCLKCGNCCKSIPPILNETDINRISRFLRLKPSDFKIQYTRVDEDSDTVMSHSPCPFLGDDNYCSVYEVRPKACREYPHTDNFEFSKNLKLHSVNSTYCPAVYHILERLKSAGDL